jgi:hypothetical protein
MTAPAVPVSTDITTSHKVLIGILLMLVVLVLITEVAGTNPQAGKLMLLLLAGPVLILGIKEGPKFSSFAAGEPPQVGIS